jgi:hypothetical protein
MATENPCPPPAPLVLADMSAAAAWRDDIPDDVRLLLEWNADTTRELCRKVCQAIHDRDQARADDAHLFALHYGPQKGGAS